MKTLIVTAHPSSKGFTHKIAKSYKTGAEKAGKEVEILNLYSKENKQDYLRFEDPSEFGSDENRKKIQEKISESTELVFVFPIWWGDAPAIMKNFLDTNFGAGFAFKYLKGGKVQGLFGDKIAKVYTTCDAPGFFYKFFLLPLNLGGVWGTYRLKFCGIKDVRFTLFDKMRKRDEDNRLELLSKVEKDGEK